MNAHVFPVRMLLQLYILIMLSIVRASWQWDKGAKQR
jgi:hypothetical protein